MGRMYTITFSAVAITAAQDLFEISPADDKPILIHGVCVGQSTEEGDAASEMLAWSIVRGHTSSGSGGSAQTGRPALSVNGAAAGFACETNNTTIASGGTPITLHADTFNVMTGLVWVPTPEMRVGASQADTTIAVRLLDAPADSFTAYGVCYVEELY